jgi:hypothetical protein
MLHLTSDEVAAHQILRAALPGTVLAWRDALHEGPVLSDVPLDTLAGIRARYLAMRGWAEHESTLQEYARRNRQLAEFFEHDEVVLWFEHRLHDQLQLLQLLDWFSHQDLEDTRLSLVGLGPRPGALPFPGFAQLDPAQVAALLPTREPVSAAQFGLARRAWGAFCSSDPRAIEQLLQQDIAALPYLRAALRRHLEQFPDLEHGLCRTTYQILMAVQAGATEPGILFEVAENREPARFLGQGLFWSYVGLLTGGAYPLLTTNDGQAFHSPEPADAIIDAPTQQLALTAAGRAVLQQRADAIQLNGIDCWRGGVHLDHRQPHWRWDPTRARLARVEPGRPAR